MKANKINLDGKCDTCKTYIPYMKLSKSGEMYAQCSGRCSKLNIGTKRTCKCTNFYERAEI